MDIIKLTTSAIEIDIPVTLNNPFSPHYEIRKDFDAGLIYAAINNAIRKGTIGKTVHCFYFGYMGQIVLFNDGKSDELKESGFIPHLIEADLYNSKISFGLERVSLTSVTLMKNFLVIKEDMKAIHTNWPKKLNRLCMSDDLENVYHHLEKSQISALQEIFLLPMLTLEELKYIDNGDIKFIKTFFHENPDVKPDDMLKSKSKSKYAFWNGFRHTITDVEFPTRQEVRKHVLGPLLLPVSENLYEQSERYSIMSCDKDNKSVIKGRLIFRNEEIVTENSLILQLNSEELDDYMSLLAYVNYVCIDSYNLSDFYHKIYHQFLGINVGLVRGEFEIQSIHDDYLEECCYRAFIPEDDTNCVTVCISHAAPTTELRE